jgi:signal transduction histidine kinase
VARVTPDALLHRYVELVMGDRIDLDALYRVITMDADLLGRWVASLGCAVEPKAIHTALHGLGADNLHGLAQGQLWGLAPLGSSARLGFDQWRTVLRAACLAEILSGRIDYPASEAARLRTLLAISGVSVAQDTLLAELAEFRGTPTQHLVDAHPLLRLFAVVEALEHQGPHAAAALCEQLCGIDAGEFGTLLRSAESMAERLIADAGIREDSGDRWRERLWLHAQLQAFSHLLAAAGDSEDVQTAGAYVTRALFGQIPRCFLFDADRGVLIAVGDDDLASLEVSAMHPRSIVARALRERRAVEADDSPELAVADRQVLRRLHATRAAAVPMLTDGQRIGVLVFNRTDADRDDIPRIMQAYATELARWLGVRRRDELLRAALIGDYRRGHEKRLRALVHEANNPLSIINNYLHVLELRLREQPDVQAQLRLIGDEIRRATTIIARAVEFPEPEAQDSDARLPAARRFDLNQLAHNLFELMRGQAETNRVQLHHSLYPDGVYVASDPDLVTQIVTNLVRNAIEAMPNGGNVWIETGSGIYREGRAGVELVVRDDGPGIAEGVLARLYEPKSTTKGGAHAGLGLHITAQLVQRLKGAIDVRTSPGRGTAFSVFVPDL